MNNKERYEQELRAAVKRYNEQMKAKEDMLDVERKIAGETGMSLRDVQKIGEPIKISR